MQEKKVCKQCGRSQSVDAYRRYVSRGKGVYKTSTGYHTVCKECENFNQLVNRAYNERGGERTQKQIELLKKAEILYKELRRRGLEPKGRFAAHLLREQEQQEASSSTERYLAALLSADPLMDRGKELLSIELVEEPDVYQNLVDKWHDSISGPDGRVKADYLDIFNRVAERIDSYEDSYEW